MARTHQRNLKFIINQLWSERGTILSQCPQSMFWVWLRQLGNTRIWDDITHLPRVFFKEKDLWKFIKDLIQGTNVQFSDLL